MLLVKQLMEQTVNDVAKEKQRNCELKEASRLAERQKLLSNHRVRVRIMRRRARATLPTREPSATSKHSADV